MRMIDSVAIAGLAIGAEPAVAQDGSMAFGSTDDIACAELLW